MLGGATRIAFGCINMFFKVNRGFIGVDHIEVLATEDLNVWSAALTLELGYSRNFNLFQDFNRRRLYHSFENPLEVVYVSDLTGLGDTPTMAKPFPSVIGDGVHRGIGEA